MAKRKHIDDILRAWKHDPHSPNVRVVKGADGRDVLQMRVDMGVLQLETHGRPDGEQPHGAATWCDYLEQMAREVGEEFVMDEDQCAEVDREFVQFYHRRICWLALHDFRRAVEDADHTLKLMDFCRENSPDEQWTLSHEQYRPFVLFHRTQAAALAELEKADIETLSSASERRNGDGAVSEEARGRCAEAAVQEINEGLRRIKGLFEEFEAEEHFDDDELVHQLIDLREKLRDRFQVGRTLHEQLSDAIQAEEYERAAVLRDKLAQRNKRNSSSNAH
jgi:hypothetical protein